MKQLLSYFNPAPHRERVPGDQIPGMYRKKRFEMMLAVFVGYAGYYLVRTNINVAKPYLIQVLGYSKTEVGLLAAAMTVAYGLSKFIMGNLSDRSNPRYFLVCGLAGSALINVFFGFLPALWMMILFWFLNGWFQGMGWPACGRTMVHWFSDRERGTKMALWNLSHNVGGMLTPIISGYAVIFATITVTGAYLPYDLKSHIWQSIFYVPAAVALIAAAVTFKYLRDTPQSEGLPPIEEFKDDYPPTQAEDREKELSGKEILFKYVLRNRYLWILSLANIVVYIVRYGVVNWAPTYLTEIKGYTLTHSAWQTALYEAAGIGGMLLSGWASDRLFHGRRAPIMVIFMALVTVSVAVYWLNPAGNYWVDSLSLFCIGFLIYGPVMLIGVAAVDLAPKKAAGTAAGLTGLFGYLGATIAEVGIGRIVQLRGWDCGFIFLIVSCFAAILLLALLWNVHDRRKIG